MTVAHDVQGDIRTLAKGAMISVAGRASGRFWSVLAQIVMARMLLPDVYGLYAIGWVILRLAGLFASMGLGRAVTYFGANFLQKKDSASFWRIILIGLLSSALGSSLIALLFFLASDWIALIVFKNSQAALPIRFFSLMIPFQALMLLSSTISRLTFKATYGVWIEDVAQPLANLFFLILFWAVGWQLTGILLGTLLSFVLGMLLGLYYVFSIFPHLPFVFVNLLPGEPSASQIFSYSFESLLPGTFAAMIVWMDRLVLGFFQPSSQVGIYQAASQFSILFNLVLASMGAVFSPMIATYYQTSQMERLAILFRITTKWGLYLVLPISAVTLMASDLVMHVIFGADYVAGGGALQILTLGQLVNVATGAVGGILLLTNHVKEWSISNLLGFSSALLLNILLSPHIGIYGAAWATATGLTLLFGLQMYFLYRRMQMLPYNQHYWKGLVAVMLSMGAVWLLNQWSIPFDFLKLVLVSFASLVVFIGILWIFKFEEEDTYIFQLIQAKIRPLLNSLQRKP